MCTGSRPSTSSTRTSRIWRATRALTLEQLEDGRQRAYRDPAVAARSHYARARGAWRRGDRDHNFVGVGIVEDARQIILRVPAHAHAVDPQTALARVVVDEADRRQTEPAVAHDLAQHQSSAVAGAGDQHAALVLAPAAKAPPAAGARRSPARVARTPIRNTSAQQPEQHDHAVGQADGRTLPWMVSRSTGRSDLDADAVNSTITTTARATAS